MFNLTLGMLPFESPDDSETAVESGNDLFAFVLNFPSNC